MKKHMEAMNENRENVALWVGRIALVLIPLIGYCLVEVLNYNNPVSSFSALQVVLNLIWYYVIIGVLYLIIGRKKPAAIVALSFFWGIGMANRYVISFRGRTIFPADFLTLGTAANVASNYSYRFDQMQTVTFVVFVACIVLLVMLPKERRPKRPGWKVVVPFLVAVILYIAVFFGTDFLARMDISPSMWTTRGNGFFLNFSVCLRYSRVEKPKGYTAEAMDTIQAGLPEEEENTAKLPANLIVIMNESYSDLSVLEGVETNEDAIPFYRSLQENTVKGYAYSSVFGGTTANSEYEFLTGNTTAFLPAGTVPYHLYVKDDDDSLVGQVGALGYRTVAMHPYYASGWNRVAVYEDFAFEETYFLEDFTDAHYMRNYVTDQSNYEKLIQMVEQKENGERLFVFNITMQNHSGYAVPWTNLTKQVWLTGALKGKYSTVDQYLSLMRESDKALEYLISYFQDCNEPTMILLFGDHQPQVATDFYTTILGGTAEEVEAETLQQRQMVPYLIWSNYELSGEEGVGPEVSLNYLSTLLAEYAGIPLTDYQRFLKSGMEVLPVVNSVGYVDENGISTDNASLLSEGAQDFLDRYRIVQYNNLFGGTGRSDVFFSPQPE